MKVVLRAVLVFASLACPTHGEETPFRVAVNGGSVTAFLQQHAADYNLFIIELTDQEILRGNLDSNRFDLLVLLGGGGRSDGQLFTASVRDQSTDESDRGGRRRGSGKATISSEVAATAERALRATVSAGHRPTILATPRVYEAIVARHPDLADEKAIVQDEQLADYLGRGHVSRKNLHRMLGYLAVMYAGVEGEIEPAAPVSITGFYHPDFGDFHPTVKDLHEWADRQGLDSANAPRALVLANYTHFVSRNQQGIDAILREFTRSGALAACVIVEESENRLNMIEFAPDVTIDAFHRGGDVEFRRQLDVPHLQALWLSGRQTVEDWRSGITHSGSMLGLESGEVSGSIEPHVVAGRRKDVTGYQPIPDRIERIVSRALAWSKLRRTPNSDKRIVMLTSGGPGGELDVPESLYRVLQHMNEAGYQLSDMPEDAEGLDQLIEDFGKQINPPEYQELDRLARSGRAALIPIAQYQQWFESKVPAEQQQEVIARWGDLPGAVMTWSNGEGEQFLVVPKVQLGNVALVPKPTPWSGDRLKEFDENKREGGNPPSHNVLATYFWLEEDYQADALVVWGTLGFDLLARGKAVGARASDWSDIMMGNMPNIRPYSLGAITFALPAKRRAKAVLVDYLPAPRLSVGLDAELFQLKSDVLKWHRVREGTLKEKFRKSISAEVSRLDLREELGLDTGTTSLTDEQLDDLSLLLAEYENERVSTVKHVLGEAPSEDVVIPYIVRCLGESFLDNLAETIPTSQREGTLSGSQRMQLERVANEAVSSLVHQELSPSEAAESAGISANSQTTELLDDLRLAAQLYEAIKQSPREIKNILAALDGRFIPPGPSAHPERNPASVPTGRNMYVLNPEEVPSRQSWEIGVRLVEDLLAKSLDEQGDYPQRIAYTIRTRATMSDFGVSEAQVLYTLGVRPTWGRSGRVSEIEIIPREELGRPRIDIFVEPKHHYAEYLESRMRLIDRAVRLVAELDEPDNRVREHTLSIAEELQKLGETDDRVRALSLARQFGVAPERFGSGLHDRLFGATGIWDDENQLADVYAHQHAFAYTEGMWGEEAVLGFRQQLKSTEVVVRSMNRGSALSGRAAYSGGMLALAAECFSGNPPTYYLSDLRSPGAERLLTAREAVRRALRTELLNGKWIEKKMAQPRGGAMAISAMLGRVLDWNITTDDTIDQRTWNQISDVYLADAKGIGLTKWLENSHPDRYHDILQTLLEASRKGYWQADADVVADMSRRLLKLEASLGSLQNESLLSYIELVIADENEVALGVSTDASSKRTLKEEQTSTADAAPAAKNLSTETPSASDPQPTGIEFVEGNRLTPRHQSKLLDVKFLHYWLVSITIVLLSLGAWLRVGSPK